MRIGDVGSVSHIGDLLAFSLAIVIVMSLVYQVDPGTGDGAKNEGYVILNSIRTIRDWDILDPNDDGIIDLDGIHDRINASNEVFPIDEDVGLVFLLPKRSIGLLFSDGHLVEEDPYLNDEKLIHGITVLVGFQGSVMPSLLNIILSGGT